MLKLDILHNESPFCHNRFFTGHRNIIITKSTFIHLAQQSSGLWIFKHQTTSVTFLSLWSRLKHVLPLLIVVRCHKTTNFE